MMEQSEANLETPLKSGGSRWDARNKGQAELTREPFADDFEFTHARCGKKPVAPVRAH
jgi:hypothetical protein